MSNAYTCSASYTPKMNATLFSNQIFLCIIHPVVRVPHSVSSVFWSAPDVCSHIKLQWHGSKIAHTIRLRWRASIAVDFHRNQFTTALSTQQKHILFVRGFPIHRNQSNANGIVLYFRRNVGILVMCWDNSKLLACSRDMLFIERKSYQSSLRLKSI